MMGVNVPLVQLLAIVMLVLLSGLPAAAREQYPGQYDNVDPVIREWVRGLKDKGGVSCCDTADGFPAEVEWDNDTGKYRVRIDGEWYVVPDSALLTEPNRLGYATIWYWYSWEVSGKRKPNIRCFIPGAGG